MTDSSIENRIPRVVSKELLRQIFAYGDHPISEAMLRRNFLNQECYKACFAAAMTYKAFRYRKQFYQEEVVLLCQFFKIMPDEWV
jgi:hypothetical protein